MTFLEFKEHYKYITRGDILPPDDKELKFFMAKAVKDIHRATTPLEKIEIDFLNFKKDYEIDDNYFVREFKLPNSDDDEIDFFDKMLIEALIYHIARARSKDERVRMAYDTAYKRALMEYELVSFDDECYDIKLALIKNGYQKPYTIKHDKNATIVWDSDFLKHLRLFLSGTSQIMPCYKNFINEFKNYQNDKKSERRDFKELDKLIKE